ncbi:ATP-binding protein [Bacteroidota bacterium]
MRQLFRGNNKYFILFGLSIIVIIVTGVISPIFINNERENWPDELHDRVERINNSIINQFNTKQIQTINLSDQLKENLSSLAFDNFEIQNHFIQLINSDQFRDLSVQIYDADHNLLAWSEKYLIDDLLIFPNKQNFGETFFINSDLITFLTVIDTFSIKQDKFFLITSLPFEKEYIIENNYFTELSFSKELSKKLYTQVEIQYSPFAQKSNDGRKYSFDLANNYNNKIAAVTFQKPNRDTELISLADDFDAVQSVFTLLSILFLGFGVAPYLNKIQNGFIRFMIAGSYILFIRITAFFFNVPSRFLEGELTNSAYFSSTFASGLVRSPLEFFITGVTFLIICIMAYNSAITYVEFNETGKRRPAAGWKYFSILFLFSTIYLLLLRGFGAAVRSVIFDSTLRYFKDPTLGLDYPMLLMNLNLLLLGICSIIISVVLILVLVQMNPFSMKKHHGYFILLFVFIQILALLYDAFQANPQGTPTIRILHILLVFLSVYFIKYLNKRTQFNYIFFALVASIVSINLLLFNNADLEKESLKTTAAEITRPNKDYLSFIVYESLVNGTEDNDILNAYLETSVNLDAVLFKLWSKSVLQREAVGCILRFYSDSMERLGTFRFRLDETVDNYILPPSSDYDDITISKEDLRFNNNSIIRGIIPITLEDNKLGYFEIIVLTDNDIPDYKDIPDFLLTSRTFFNSAIDFSILKIFDFRNEELKSYHADVKLTEEEMNSIINADYSVTNEKWLSIPIHEEDHLVYCLKVSDESGSRIVAVALQERDPSWSLFGFFKVFLVHVLLILLLLVGIIILLIWQRKIVYISFRNKLLAAFLIISIIPLILLAVYFGEITEKKNLDAISYKLGKRAVKVEKYLNDYSSSSVLNYETILKKAERDLGISYSLYDNGDLLYCSEEMYYRIGLLPPKLNPVVYNKIYNSGYIEYVIPENIEEYKFSSYYYKCNIAGKDFVIQVSDVFNSIILPLSDIEMDIFIFSTYSLAAILIIIISTIFANQISSPIIRLTKATKSIAGGDLNFELKENYKGEVKGLVDNFNIMIKQLKKSQSELALMEREAAWKEMAKQVAHEIKNPLTPMKLSIQQLITAYKDKSKKFDEIFNRVTGTVIDQIETLRNIASEFSSFARMPSLNVELINIVSVAEEAVNLFKEEDASIGLSSEAYAVMIMADTEQLKRTVINLIRNSLQAEAKEVRVKIAQSDDECFLRVEDNGKGIPSEIINNVFDEEFTTKIKGMGLGLSMAKRFISSINASISVENTSSNGTVILITFPKSD